MLYQLSYTCESCRRAGGSASAYTSCCRYRHRDLFEIEAVLFAESEVHLAATQVVLDLVPLVANQGSPTATGPPMERATGLEPVTSRLEIYCSTN